MSDSSPGGARTPVAATPIISLSQAAASSPVTFRLRRQWVAEGLQPGLGSAVGFGFERRRGAGGAFEGAAELLHLITPAVARQVDPFQSRCQSQERLPGPDGMRLACACANHTIRLWDMKTHTSVAELHGHTAYVYQFDFSPDGTRLVSASGDFTVRVWDTLSAKERAEKKNKTGRK